MIRLSLASAALLIVACATQKPLEASATIEEIPNTPTAAPDAGPTPWAKLETDGFSVMLPAPLPEAQRKVNPTNIGEIPIASWSTKEKDVLYTVTIVDYPEAMVRKNKSGPLLNAERDGLVNSLKGTLKEEAVAVEIDGHPGKTYSFSSEQGDGRARNYLVGNRMYTLLTLYSPNFGAPRAEEFLNSLTLTAPVEPIYRGSGMSADGGTMMSSDGGTMMGAEGSAEMGTEAPDAGTPAPAKPKKKKK